LASRDGTDTTDRDPAAPAAEDLFREINERILELGERFGFRGEPILELICECEDGCCAEHIRIPAPAYEQLRHKPGRHVVAPGHEGAREVVARAEGYAVVSD
jgi:hypothetical protein